jgi:signal transduction histidine kinase
MARWHMRLLCCVDLQRAGTSVGLLAVGFNEHTGPFAPRQERLLRSIAQQAAMALENARLVDSLRAASRLKSEFIGTMSHELRSPLNVVIGYVDLLLDGEMGPVSAEQHETLERVRQHALQLLELIKETLDVNRLEAGRLPLDVETFTVGAFIDDLKSSVPAEWLKPGVVLRWQVGAPLLAMRSDRGKLKKVVRNLIQNALKFTDHGAVVTSVASANGWLELAVSDTGIGIAADEIPIIFEMFRQVDGSMTRRHGGVGLGLYIVKQLVRALGGDISVTSRPGSGSTFRVRIRSAGPSEPHMVDAPVIEPRDRQAS